MPVDYTTAADFAPATNQGGNGRPARGKRGLDKEEVRAAAAGRWREVLEAAGFDPATLDGQHHGCPRCAGTDRFRYVDSAAGAVFCNQCGRGIGDGFASVAWLQQISFPEAVEFVADAVGFTVGPARKVVSAAPPAPPATPAPAAPPPASSTAAAPEVDPAADIAWREWDSDFKKYAAQYAEAKPGVTVDAIKAAGGRPAIFTRRRKDGRTERVPVFAFAMTDASLDLSKPTGWVAVVANGAPFWKSGPKVMLTPGSKSGLLGGHAIEELKACRQHDSLARLHLWRCEGLNDLLALSGTIPDSERSRHVVITSGAGC
ncbi:primase-helicase zinc-binding domain-containing protein, partial [Botrimarina sp.]|uniref:primase-helicase zinc-binding domain-containing protein n=1 Tax=Botrimarina sp. TaxID=2795802 RepID=UPI0032EEC544